MNSCIFSKCLQHCSLRLPLRTDKYIKLAFQVRHGHWYSKYYKVKWNIRPVSQEVLEKYKERSVAKLPDNKLAPVLLRKYLESSEVPELVKQIHSYDFKNIEAAIADVIKEQIMEQGLDPLEDSTAHEIVRLTVRIRVQREQMHRKNSAALERAFLEMLDRREVLLSRLRSEDYNSFLGLIQGLQLNYEHARKPLEVEPPRPGFPQRLAEISNRCHRLKLRRLADLSEKTEAAKADFLRRREATLAEARDKLGSLSLSLEQVLDEVYGERREAAERELLEDKLQWYYGEQREHLRYIARLAEKAKSAGQQAKGRKK